MINIWKVNTWHSSWNLKVKNFKDGFRTIVIKTPTFGLITKDKFKKLLATQKYHDLYCFFIGLLKECVTYFDIIKFSTLAYSGSFMLQTAQSLATKVMERIATKRFFVTFYKSGVSYSLKVWTDYGKTNVSFLKKAQIFRKLRIKILNQNTDKTTWCIGKGRVPWTFLSPFSLNFEFFCHYFFYWNSIFDLFSQFLTSLIFLGDVLFRVLVEFWNHVKDMFR